MEPKVPGRCRAYIPRFFYNATVKECQQFIWGGCSANGNNFNTHEECLSTCPPADCFENLKIGPCRAAFPRYYFDKNTKECRSFSWGGCEPNGNNFLSLEDCVKFCPVNNCMDTLKVGPCKAAFPRYYFNSDTRQCELFSWGGCEPNGNNFELLSDCQKSCPVYNCSEPQKVGPCRAAINRYYFNSVTRKCELFSWGGCQPNGNNFETLDECKKTCPVYNCSDIQKVGPCRGSSPRYSYNKETKKCEKFFWGGCEQNGNNFQTLETCQSECECSNCKDPLKVGPCDGMIPRYYYDKTDNQCRSFNWGGCKANGNNFSSYKDCMKSCKKYNCSESRKVGPCRGQVVRYYFNPTTDKCEKFSWGGCQPNNNNFESLSDCQKICLNK